MKEVEIIFEDSEILLCRKPAGVATQTKRLGQQDMESLLKNYRAKKGESPYIGVVHRLDQPVEGLMVFAKNQKAAANLSRQIQGHMIGKHYYAVSHCVQSEENGILEDYLLTDKKMNFSKVVDIENLRKEGKEIPKEAKPAKLEYKKIEEYKGNILFDIHLHTGRQHQIRVQMANMGCPLLGDSKYGDGKSEGGLALCSYRLEFLHPVTGKKMDYKIVPQGAGFQGFF